MRVCNGSKTIWVSAIVLLGSAFVAWVGYQIYEAKQTALYLNLWSSAEECNALEVEGALRDGANPNGHPPDKFGTPLQRAKGCQDKSAYELLKKAGARE